MLFRSDKEIAKLSSKNQLLIPEFKVNTKKLISKPIKQFLIKNVDDSKTENIEEIKKDQIKHDAINF